MPSPLRRPVQLLAILGSLTLLPLAIASVPQSSRIVSLRGTFVKVQQGSERPVFAQVGNRLQNRSQTLLIPGNDYSLARLSFIGGSQEYAGLVVQAGPNLQQTYYQFPCTVRRGKVTLSWRQGSNRGCEDGIYLSPRGRSNKANKSSENDLEGVLIQPKKDQEVVLQAVTIGDRRIIDMLVGEVELTTAAHPNGVTLRAGQRYRISGNQTKSEVTFESIDQAAILATQELQEFFTPSRWDNAKGIDQALARHLGDVSPTSTTVSTPGTTEQPRDTQLTAAIDVLDSQGAGDRPDIPSDQILPPSDLSAFGDLPSECLESESFLAWIAELQRLLLAIPSGNASPETVLSHVEQLEASPEWNALLDQGENLNDDDNLNCLMPFLDGLDTLFPEG